MPSCCTGTEHRSGGNHLAHAHGNAHGDAINAILAAAGCNFSLLLKWLRDVLRLIALAWRTQPRPPTA